MADNYIENKFEKMKEREAAKVRERQAAYRKRMEAYRRKLALEASQEAPAENEAQKAPAGYAVQQNTVSGIHSDKE